MHHPFLSYLLGERSPHWNPLARAVLEEVALNLRLILDTLSAQVIAIVEPVPAHMPLYDELAALCADAYAALARIYARLHNFSEGRPL